MAIQFYSGTPGSGKGLKVVYRIIWWLETGADVIANFPIDMSYFKRKKGIGNFTYIDNDEMTVDYLIDYHNTHHKKNMKPQTLVVIDEAQCMFNCRQWENKDRNGWIKFFSMHRHLNYDIILISQSDRLLDRQIRAFIETEYKCRALRNYKLFGRFLSFLFGGLFCAVEYWYGPNLRCGSELYLLHKRKARIYDTMKLFDNLGGKIDDGSVSRSVGVNNLDCSRDKAEEKINDEVLANDKSQEVVVDNIACDMVSSDSNVSVCDTAVGCAEHVARDNNVVVSDNACCNDSNSISQRLEFFKRVQSILSGGNKK